MLQQMPHEVSPLHGVAATEMDSLWPACSIRWIGSSTSAVGSVRAGCGTGNGSPRNEIGFRHVHQCGRQVFALRPVSGRRRQCLESPALRQENRQCQLCIPPCTSTF